MNKQEAEVFFKEGRTYHEFGTFLAAVHGPLDMLKDAQKESVIPKFFSKIKTDQRQKTGTLLIDNAMQYPCSIVEWIDFAVKYPELEIAVTGTVVCCNTGTPVAFSWYSPAGSSELNGTSDDDPIGGQQWPMFFLPADGFPPFPGTNNLCRLSAPLGLWQEDDHDGGWVAVWKNNQGDLGYTDLLYPEHLEWYNEEDEDPIPPKVVAAAGLVSKLDSLEVNPEGKQVILDLWKVLFPDANIHIQWEDGRYRYLDDAGSEYYLATSYYNETTDGGVFFGRYLYEEALGMGDDLVTWGFPPTATWIPKDLLLVYKQCVDDEDEDEDDCDD